MILASWWNISQNVSFLLSYTQPYLKYTCLFSCIYVYVWKSGISAPWRQKSLIHSFHYSFVFTHEIIDKYLLVIMQCAWCWVFMLKWGRSEFLKPLYCVSMPWKRARSEESQESCNLGKGQGVSLCRWCPSYCNGERKWQIRNPVLKI